MTADAESTAAVTADSDEQDSPIFVNSGPSKQGVNLPNGRTLVIPPGSFVIGEYYRFYEKNRILEAHKGLLPRKAHVVGPTLNETWAPVPPRERVAKEAKAAALEATGAFVTEDKVSELIEAAVTPLCKEISDLQGALYKAGGKPKVTAKK